MPKEVLNLEYSPDNNVAKQTKIDLSDYLRGRVMDVRGTNDPVVTASLEAGNTGTASPTIFNTTSETSDGQGAATEPASGHMAVVDATTIALGDALNATDMLQLVVELRGGENIPS